MDELVELSHRYGRDLLMVQGGGGNTSAKTGEDEMWIKASGCLLAEVSQDRGFVRVNLADIRAIMENRDLARASPDERDEWVKDRMLAAVRTGHGQRPSIETLLHALLPERLVVHTHPVLVLGLTCRRDGRDLAVQLFPDLPFTWVRYEKPGYPLAMAMASALKAPADGAARAVFLENHGLIVSANQASDLVALTDRIINRLKQHFGHQEENFAARHPDPIYGERLERALERENAGDLDLPLVCTADTPMTRMLPRNPGLAAGLLRGALYPDHVVYLGHRPLEFHRDDDVTTVQSAWREFVQTHHYRPRYALVDGEVLLLVGAHTADISNKRDMIDTQIRVLRLLDPDQACYLNDTACATLLQWEWEKYRDQKLKTG